MNAKHTPGDWKAVKQERNVHRIMSGDREILFYSSWSNVPEEEHDANANLLAAAPDLIKEIERFLPVLQHLENSPATWEIVTRGLGIATLNSYKAAIAKAKGETP